MPRNEAIGVTALAFRLPPASFRTDANLRNDHLETHGPLGTIWVGLGLSAFYVALIWINSLLGLFLTPLFIIPITWFIGGKKPAAPRGDQ